jgi:ATP-dependent 26S proteasome regulatory subunit
MSTVILVETEDEKRIQQLKEFVTDPKAQKLLMKREEDVRILWSDTWEGIREHNLEKNKWEEVKSESPFPMMGSDLGMSIRKLDEIIKKYPSIAVIANITKKEMADAISTALLNWSCHPGLIENKSTVFVITPDTSLFDEYTRHACIVVSPPYSTEDERKELLGKMAKEFKLRFDKILIDASAGMTLHDLESAVLSSVHRKNAIELDAITETKMELIRKRGYELVYPRLTWKNIGGYDTVKTFLKENIISIIKDETARKWGVGANRGNLLFGPPGTGKTLLAKVMSKELGLPFIQVSAETLFKSFVGETERAIKTLVRVIEENAPCVAFIDEVDQLALRRDSVVSTDSGVGRRAQNMIMEYLGDDERKSIIVGATNTPEQLDEAFIRAGRFDAKIPLLWPDSQARVEIIKVHTSVTRNIPLKDVDLEKVSAKTHLWSGAEIELLCTTAARVARAKGADEVTQLHFDAALEDLLVNQDQRTAELKKFVAQAKRFTSSTRLLNDQLKEFLDREKTVVGKDRLQALKEAMGV